MLVGYARVSTPDQEPGYQLKALRERGCQRIFTYRSSGRITGRPQLTAALEFLRDGDTLVVWKFDRLARNLRYLIELGVEFERRGYQLVSLTEAIDTGSPGGKLVFAVFGAMTEFEADLNRERTQASARAHKAAGRRWGRPSPFHDPKNVRIAKAMLADPSIPRTPRSRDGSGWAPRRSTAGSPEAIPTPSPARHGGMIYWLEFKNDD